ncbi:MAG: hypothetical protein E7105_03485 [Prevotella sp.]|nr:hypothetical protein [Prevotella sp.]
MKRQKHIFVWMACGLVLVAALAAGITYAVRRDRAMYAALRELQEWNQADTVFTSDSVARMLVAYFDHPWHSANDQMLAHYLLGRAHADMGEAPQAIEDYQTAVECADTTDQDCDFRLLRNVYGQMAEVFHAQNLPEDELKADSAFIHYSWVIGDTLEAIMGEGSLIKPFFLLSDTSNMLRTAQKTEKELLEYGRPDFAAMTYVGITYIYIERADIDQAKMHIDQIRAEAGIFDKEGNLRPGCEMFYYTLGLYFDTLNRLDSAEYYYRRVLASNKLEAGYKGLLSVYSKRGIADSIAKFAPLYADANDAMHREMNSAEVHKTTSLYNYNRHLRTAKEEQQKSQKRLIALYVTIIIILALVITGYYLYTKNLEKERKREHALNTIQQNYIKVSQDYHSLLAENEEKHSYTTELEQQLNELREEKEQLELLANSLRAKNKVGNYYAHELVQKIIDCAIQRKNVPSGKDFILLRELFCDTFPHFKDFVAETHPLSDYEWYVCILVDMGMGNSDMAFLMGQGAQRMNNIQRQANRLLFKDDTSSTLPVNLRAVIHAT